MGARYNVVLPRWHCSSILAKKVDFKPKKNLKVRQRRPSFLPELHPFKNNKLFVRLTAGASARGWQHL